MSTCENCLREFPGGYPLYCACGHVTGREAGYSFESQANAWRVLHSRFAAAIKSGVWEPSIERAWFAETWSTMIPRRCGCAESWPKLLARIGINWDSAETAFHSSWELHNAVSIEHAGNPPITFEQARFLFLDEPPVRDRCVVTIGTGAKFRELLRVSRQSLLAYAERCNADYYEITDPQFVDWKREKFRVYDFASRYQRTLFVDADCWIRPSCPDLFEVVPTNRVAMHDDRPFQASSDWIKKHRRELYASQEIVADPDTEFCLNSGVVLCSKESAGVWLPPKKPFPNFHIAEQLLVEYQAMQTGPVEILPRRFNCQFWMNDFATASLDSDVIHLADCRSKLAEMRKLAAA